MKTPDKTKPRFYSPPKVLDKGVILTTYDANGKRVHVRVAEATFLHEGINTVQAVDDNGQTFLVNISGAAVRMTEVRDEPPMPSYDAWSGQESPEDFAVAPGKWCTLRVQGTERGES